MMCLKDLLLYTLLLPIPAASPVFIALYGLALMLTIRPCGYCIAMFATLFLTCSPSSPFLTKPHPQLPIDPLRLLTSPTIERDWFSTNAGRWADPGLMGYRHIADLWSSSTTGQAASAGGRSPVPVPAGTVDVPLPEPACEPSPAVSSLTADTASETPSPSTARWSFLSRLLSISRSSSSVSATTHTSEEVPEPVAPAQDMSDAEANADAATPCSTSTTFAESAPLSPSSGLSFWQTRVWDLPARYLDLRVGGVGVVLDWGFARSEEGVAWEVADAKRAAQAVRDKVEARQSGLDEEDDDDLPAGRPDEASDTQPCEPLEEVEDVGNRPMRQRLWARLPLVGDAW